MSTSSSDTIRRFLIENSDIRGEIVTLEHSFQTALAAQKLDTVLAPLFGEFITASAMMSEILKFDGIVTLQARGNGPLSLIMAETNYQGHFRGVVNAEADSALVNHDNGKLKALQELIGKGVLAITLDPSDGKPYQGIVELDKPDLSACLRAYFIQSEQLPTHIVLFASDKQCGGIFLQALPARKEITQEVREEQWQTAIQLVGTVKEDEFFKINHETLLFRLFHELNFRMFDPKLLEFKCRCSRERSLNALASFEPEELKQIIAEEKKIEMDCQFCGQHYQFDESDIERLS